MTSSRRRVPEPPSETSSGGDRASAVAPGAVATRIHSLLPSLLPAEQQVARVLVDQHTDLIDLSSQQVAQLAGTSRATVVRACQSLGFTGYQQVRVLLARDAALQRSAAPRGHADRSPAAAAVLDRFDQVGAAAATMTTLLTAEAVEQAVDLLASAPRVLVAANGLSTPLASDAAARLARIGVSTVHHVDVLSQLVAARLLDADDVAFVISGSGAHVDSLGVARAAGAAGARVLALTGFARSPLTALADVSLVAGLPGSGFADELTETTRVPQLIMIEGLAAALRGRLGERAARAEALALEIVSGHVGE